MGPPEEPPSTSEQPVANEDDEGPPNLLIDEEDDDGYPNTPPILERQDYYMENEEEEPAPCPNAPPIPNKFFKYESEFYLPHNLRRLNPSRYVAHSHHFLLDLICILCQRVCNETHAVSCFANHRFCKDCIKPRLEKYGFCPRCGDKALGEAKPDPTYDKIIERMRYRKDEVNYVCLDPDREDQELSDYERDTSEEDSDIPDDEYSYRAEIPPPVKPLGDQRHEFGEFIEKEIEKIRAAREADAKIVDAEVLKRKRLLQKRISPSACPPYKYMQEHQLFDIVGDMLPPNPRNLFLECTKDGLKAGVHDIEDWMMPIKQSPRFATYLPPRWNPQNLRKPLQNMVYKTFWFNKDIEWPKNEPVPHPMGLTPSRLRDHKLMAKARRRIGNDPFLSKREKKISLHKFFTTQLEENLDLSEFPSSSDDDEPPPKFCQFPFDYPSNYRRPRKDWRRLYDDEGNVRNGVKAKNRDPRTVALARMARRWQKDWGEPLQLLRESSTQSTIPFQDLKRIYLGAPKQTTIGHIQDLVYRKIALLKSLKLEQIKKRFHVNLHPVLWHGNGRNVEVIQCTDQTQLPGQLKSPVKPAQQPPPNPEPLTAANKIHIYQNRTPTVRDLAIKTMNMGIKINPTVMDEDHVVQLQYAINSTESPEKPTGKNAKTYQYKPRTPRQPNSRQGPEAPKSSSSTVLTLINSTPMNGISGRPTLAVAPFQPSTSATPTVAPLVSLTNGQTPVVSNTPVMLTPSSKKTPILAESPKETGSPPPVPGSLDGPPLLTPVGRASAKLNEPNPEIDKYFTPPPNQPIVNTNPLLNLEGREGLIHRMMGVEQPTKRPALQPRVLANGLTQASAIALARALPPGATLTGVPGIRPSILYPAPIGGTNRSGFQTIKLAGPSTSGNDAPINLVPVVTQGDHIQYMQLTPDGKCIPLHASTLGGNILAITPPKGGINGAPGPTFLKPMTTRDGRPYLQQVEPIIMQQQPQPPPPPPQPPVLQGAATGRRLSKKLTAFFINTPHVRLDLNVRTGDLRKQAGLKKGSRLVLVFSIHDLKCDEEIDLDIPKTIPPLRKRRTRNYRRSIEKRPRYSDSSSDEEDKKEEEEEAEEEEAEEEDEKMEENEEKEDENVEEEEDDD